MSNEKDTVNFPRSHGGRYRKFSCITYLTEDMLSICLLKHLRQIRVYAYALHDKDVDSNGELKQPHFHLILITYNTCTISAVKRWFNGYVDINGDINTFVEKCNDEYAQFDYLSHNTKECIAKGKYLYDKSIVKTNDREYFDAVLKSDFDTVTLATEMLLDGRPVREVGQIFGRDFILRYPAIRRYIADIWLQENSGDDNLSTIVLNEIDKR